MVKHIPFQGGERPFSTAVQAGNTLYVSGQVGIDRAAGAYPEGIEAQTRVAISNLSGALEQAGYHLTDVVKMTVLLTDVKDIPTFNLVYKEAFSADPPARTLSVVKALAGEAIVELDAVAYRE